VPYLGAQAAFLKTEKLVCVCDDDFGYWELKDRLLEGVAAGLHATLPLMNLVQRLVVSHFLERGMAKSGADRRRTSAPRSGPRRSGSCG